MTHRFLQVKAVLQHIGHLRARFLGRPTPFAELQGLSFPSIEGALQCLRLRGFRPRFVVDVGAYHGEWTLTFKKLFPDTRVLMVEAQEQKLAVLQSVCSRFAGSVECCIGLLGATSGQRIRFVEMETGSSAYEERSGYPRRVTEKSTLMLDDLTGGSAVDFLKLDVQGYELEVLRGAQRALGETQGVLMEASLVPINDGAPLLADVVQFMDRHGFRVVDFCSQIRRRDGVLWQTDLLFLRSSSEFIPDARLTSENWN